MKKSVTVAIVVVVALLLLFIVGTSLTGNVVSEFDSGILDNGGFDSVRVSDGIPTGWQFHTDGAGGLLSILNDELHVLSIQGYGYALQKLPDLVPGTVYEVSFQAVGTGEDNPAPEGQGDGEAFTHALIMIQDNLTWNALAYYEVTSYHPAIYSFNFSIPQGDPRDYHIVLATSPAHNASLDRWAFFDNVSINAVPGLTQECILPTTLVSGIHSQSWSWLGQLLNTTSSGGVNYVDNQFLCDPSNGSIWHTTYSSSWSQNFPNNVQVHPEGYELGDWVVQEDPNDATRLIWVNTSDDGGITPTDPVVCKDDSQCSENELCVRPLTDDAVLYLTFDDGSANDSSMYGNNGTLENGTQLVDVAGRGKVAQFVRSNENYIRVPDADQIDFGNANFSVAFWIKTSGDEQNFVFAKSYDNATSGYGLYRTAFYLTNGSRGGSDGNDRSQNPNFAAANFPGWRDNQWHYVTIVSDKDVREIRYYVDGVLFDTAQDQTWQYWDSPEETSLVNSFDLLIGVGHDKDDEGGSLSSGNFFLDGMLDEFAMYDRALTLIEVSQAYANENPEGLCVDAECTADPDCQNGYRCMNNECIYVPPVTASVGICENPLNADGLRLPAGYRYTAEVNSENVTYYCDPTTQDFVETFALDISCANDYQCGSNLCLDGKCTSIKPIREDIQSQRDLLSRLLCFLEEIFGGNLCPEGS